MPNRSVPIGVELEVEEIWSAGGILSASDTAKSGSIFDDDDAVAAEATLLTL
jgi:hypothetical protein